MKLLIWPVNQNSGHSILWPVKSGPRRCNHCVVSDLVCIL